MIDLGLIISDTRAFAKAQPSECLAGQSTKEAYKTHAVNDRVDVLVPG